MIDSESWSDDAKIRMFMILNMIIAAMLGFTVWLLVRNLFDLGGPQWALCFIGYPAVIEGVVGTLFLYNHRQWH